MNEAAARGVSAGVQAQLVRFAPRMVVTAGIETDEQRMTKSFPAPVLRSTTTRLKEC